jgi:hypothetical protein
MLVRTKLREGLVSGQETRVRTGATGLRAHASEAGGCTRSTAYSIMAGRPDWSPTLSQEVAFRIGRDLEKAAMESARLQNESVRGQVPWTLEDGKISGVADGTYYQGEFEPEVEPVVFSLYDTPGAPQPKPGELVVMEVKSMAERYFQKAMKDNSPTTEHILQASLGAVALGTTWIHIVYLSKGAKQSEEPILEWVMEIDQGQVKTAIEDLLIAVNSAEAGEVPPPWHQGELIVTPNPKRPPCLWCAFVDRCHEDKFDAKQAWEGRIG